MQPERSSFIALSKAGQHQYRIDEDMMKALNLYVMQYSGLRLTIVSDSVPSSDNRSVSTAPL